jgi:hypothetical protein
MPEPLIHVARGEAEFGAYSLAEAREMMEAGFFLRTDEAWVAGMSEWRPLGETIARLTAEGADWRDKVVAGAEGLSRVLGRSVGQFVAGVKTHAGPSQESFSHAKRKALEQYVPQFKQLLGEQFRDKPAAIARAALRDDTVMRNVFGAVYDCLPNALRRFVPQAVFIEFCLEHRQRLVGDITVSKSTPGISDDASRA